MSYIDFGSRISLYSTGFLPIVEEENLVLAFPFRHEFFSWHFALPLLLDSENPTPRPSSGHRMPKMLSASLITKSVILEVIAKSRKPDQLGQKWIEQQKLI
jgi:hypothetical protein